MLVLGLMLLAGGVAVLVMLRKEAAGIWAELPVPALVRGWLRRPPWPWRPLLPQGPLRPQPRGVVRVRRANQLGRPSTQRGGAARATRSGTGEATRAGRTGGLGAQAGRLPPAARRRR